MPSSTGLISGSGEQSRGGGGHRLTESLETKRDGEGHDSRAEASELPYCRWVIFLALTLRTGLVRFIVDGKGG